MVEVAGVVAGFASWGEQRDDAMGARGFTDEVSALYLLRAIQDQGHGRATMARAAQGLLRRGHGGASVWVIRKNLPALSFYERLGGVSCGEQDDTLADQPVMEVAYGLVTPGRPRESAAAVGRSPFRRGH